MVDTPDVIEHAILAPAHQVAGAVQAPALGAEWVGDEALGRLPRMTMVAPRDTPSADVQLADHAHR